MEFVPGAISALKLLAGLDYELVLATNQDGLGTEAFPEEQFLPPHKKMLRRCAARGSHSMTSSSTARSSGTEPRHASRGPGCSPATWTLRDLAASFVIGDRITDIELARNLRARGILLAPDAAEGLHRVREAGLTEACALVAAGWGGDCRISAARESGCGGTARDAETQIVVRLDLDGRGDFNGQISTGLLSGPHAAADRPPRRRGPRGGGSRRPRH